MYPALILRICLWKSDLSAEMWSWKCPRSENSATQGCEIQKIAGDYIMSREGVFARILKGGVIRVGDEMKILEKVLQHLFYRY